MGPVPSLRPCQDPGSRNVDRPSQRRREEGRDSRPLIKERFSHENLSTWLYYLMEMVQMDYATEMYQQNGLCKSANLIIQLNYTTKIKYIFLRWMRHNYLQWQFLFIKSIIVNC